MSIICNFIGAFDFRLFPNDHTSTNWLIDCFKKVVSYSKLATKYAKPVDLKCSFSFSSEEPQCEAK